MSLLFALLTFAVKEEAPLYIAVCAIYFIFNHKNYKCNLCILFLCVICFVLVTRLMGVYGEGIMSDSRYGDYIYDNGGIFTVIKSVIQNPIYAIYRIFTPEKLIFILQMLLPLGFLPIIIKKPSKLILLIPFILVNLMTSYPYQFDIGFQYTFGSGALLFYLALTNYSELTCNGVKVLLCALLSSVLIFAGGYASAFGYIETYVTDAERREHVETAFSLIPENADVACSTFFVANLSQRDVVYELESTSQNAEFIVVDLRYEENRIYLEKYSALGYSVIFLRDNAVAVLAAPG